MVLGDGPGPAGDPPGGRVRLQGLKVYRLCSLEGRGFENQVHREGDRVAGSSHCGETDGALAVLKSRCGSDAFGVQRDAVIGVKTYCGCAAVVPEITGIGEIGRRPRGDQDIHANDIQVSSRIGCGECEVGG